MFKRLSTVFLVGCLIVGVFGAMPLPSKAAYISGGDLIKGSQAAVYYYGSDGNRYAFPNENTYFTWYSGFSIVTTISDNELAAIPLKGNVTYRPGYRMLKIQTDPKVYAIDQNATLRWVTSESIATSLYSSKWNTKIDDISDAFFVNYQVGLAINSLNDFDKEGLLATATNISVDKNLKGAAQLVATPLPAAKQTTPKPAEAPSAPILSAPASVAASIPFIIDWAPSSNAESYVLAASTDVSFSGPSTIYEGSNTVANHKITKKHFYKVRGENGIGLGPWSNVVEVDVACTSLDNPQLTTTSAEVTSGEKFALNWTEVGGASGYTLERDGDPSFSSPTIIPLAALKSLDSIQVISVSNNTPYYFRVRASNACGVDKWSNAVSVNIIKSATSAASTGGCSALAKPVIDNLGSAVYSGSLFTVSWSAVPDTEVYVLQRDTEPAFTNPLDIPLSSQASTGVSEDPEVAKDTTFYYRVKAVNGCGESAWSSAASKIVKAPIAVCPKPSAPSINMPAVSVNSGESYTVGWNAVSGATGYTLEYDTDSSFSNPMQAALSSPTATSIAENHTVTQDTTYYYRVKAKNSCGESGWSSVVSKVVKVPAPLCAKPSQPAIKDLGAPIDSGKDFYVTWDAVAMADSYLLLRSLESTPSTASSFVFYTLGKEVASQKENLFGFANTTHYYQLQAKNSCGNSAWSAVKSKLVKACLKPSTPKIEMSAASVYSGVSYTFGWNAVSGATGYTLEYDTNSSFSNPIQWKGDPSNPTATSLTESHTVTKDTTYYYRVKAKNSCGESGWSVLASKLVKICPALSAPDTHTGVSSVLSGASFSVGWVAITGATGYALQYATDASFTNPVDVMLSSPTQTSTSLSLNVAADTKFYFRAKANNSCGASAWGQSAGITVQAIIP